MRQQPESLTVIDSHAHLQDPRFAEDVEEVIARAIQGGVEMIICIGYDLESSRAAVELTRRHREIRAVVGIHPHDAKTINDRVLAEVWDLARDPRVVAIGETGLDYYRNLSSPDEQRKGFRAQINLAKKLGKPIVIHDRDAHEEVLSIIAGESRCQRGIMHCYSGRLPLAVELMKQGFMISRRSPTFSNAKKSVEVAARVPLDRILVETDCPYLTPSLTGARETNPCMFGR